MIDWQTEFDKLRRNPRTPVIGTLFFGICFLWSTGAFITTFLEKNPSPPPKIAKIMVPPVNLGELHLFGVYNVAQANLPTANSQLTLQGTIVVTDSPNESQALIAAPGQPAEVYHVGDTLPGNATITHISGDNIVINQNGTFEKLLLPIQTVTNSE
ncbi:MAG: type II secretion system protein N [Coxiellaceae bacterium]|nr:type II secretion system protein N [Coxiellaceae bacterium]